MVIDDDADIRESITDVLEMRGYRVQSAVNGRQALDLLREGTRPCVILLDLMMPVLNGWEFRAEQTRDERLKTVPVVVIPATDRPTRRRPPWASASTCASRSSCR